MIYNVFMIDRGKTLEKLYMVFKGGYRPSRLLQSYYDVTVDQKFADVSQITNCLAHAFFNLTNDILLDYGFTKEDKETFRNWQGDESTIFDDVVHFVRDTGLKVEECSKTIILKDPKSWLVHAYFRPEDEPWAKKDFHFVLDESPAGKSVPFYTHRLGFRNEVMAFQGVPEKIFFGYTYHATYTVTNPNADFSNKYTKSMLEREQALEIK